MTVEVHGASASVANVRVPVERNGLARLSCMKGSFGGLMPADCFMRLDSLKTLTAPESTSAMLASRVLRPTRAVGVCNETSGDSNACGGVFCTPNGGSVLTWGTKMRSLFFVDTAGKLVPVTKKAQVPTRLVVGTSLIGD